MEESLNHVPKRSDREEDGAPDKVCAEDDESKKKPFMDFVEKLSLLVIGFGLTTLAGGYLANKFRRETAKTEFEIAAMQSDISRSVQVFESVSQLMDKRLYRMRRLHDVFNGNVSSDVLPQRLSDYRVALIEWNDNLNRYRALDAFYFPPDAGRPMKANFVDVGCGGSFENIARKFTDTHDELQKLIDKKPDGSEKNVKSMIDNLNICVYGLDESMLERIGDLRSKYRDKIANQ